MNKKFLSLLILPLVFTVSSCGKTDPYEKYFSLWNVDASNSIRLLKEYVEDVTNVDSKNFIPVEDRIATFDMDGTFIGELYPTYFEYNLLEYRVLEDLAPLDVKEAAQTIRDYSRGTISKFPDHFDMTHAFAAAKAYSGMSLSEFDAYVKKFASKSANGFLNMTYGESFYKPMLQIFDYLADNQFTSYVVSGSDRYICRQLVKSLGFERILLTSFRFLSKNSISCIV